MSDLQTAGELVSSARFKYGSQIDLVKLIRLTDPNDLDLSLTLQAVTSPRFQEIYSKITGSRGRVVGVDGDYSDTTITTPGSRKALPLEDPTAILPLGIRRFVADLDEFLELSETERIIPLMRVVKKEDREAVTESPMVYAPKINSEVRTIDPSDAGRLNRLIEDKIYAPRLERCKAIGGIARGLRPQFISYVDVRRDPITTKDCLDALSSVPERNVITYFRIGAKPRDAGGREYYDWQSSTTMQMWPGEDEFRIEFDEPIEIRKMEERLREQGINLLRLAR